MYQKAQTELPLCQNISKDNDGEPSLRLAQDLPDYGSLEHHHLVTRIRPVTISPLHPPSHVPSRQSRAELKAKICQPLGAKEPNARH
jgi:hypothetical protein